jgi:heme-degrading monooxygenase HmoA
VSIKKGLYQHYKGPMYRVLDVAKHSETEEELVIYQALYGDKGFWARPMTMFAEMVEVDGQSQPRFAFCDDQTEVLEVAILDVKKGMAADFEIAFGSAKKIIARMPGYMSHELRHCVENPSRYILLVNWQTLEAHTEGFRGSAEYQQWRELLHHFYQPFPVVEHYR